MARFYFALPIMLFLDACQTAPHPRPPMYEGGLSYPVTELSVGTSLRLTHKAGPPVDRESEQPPLYGSEGLATHSIYELRTANGQLLLTVPSMLADPKYTGDFEDYHRRFDELSVHLSPSGNSILLVEDYTTALPSRTHILLQQGTDGNWTWNDLKVEKIRQERTPQSAAVDIYGTHPQVAAISDSEIWFSTKDAVKRRFCDLMHTSP